MTAPEPPGSGAARPIGEILKALLRSKRFYERRKYGALVDAWRTVVGEDIARHTRIVAFEGGEVLVEVDAPVLLHELSGFMRSALLAHLQRTRGGEDVAALRFRLGPVDDG